MSVLPGEGNRVDSDAFFASLEGVQSKIRNGGMMASLFTSEDGFTGTSRGVEARIVNDSPTAIDELSPQYTVGVPMSTLNDVMWFAKKYSGSAGPRELDSIEAGLDFGTQVAARYLSERSLGRVFSAPRFAVEAIEDPDVNALRNFIALLFTQAIAPVHMMADEAAGERVRWAKSHMVVASRHSPHVLRQSLSRGAKEFLESNAGSVRNLFRHYAHKVVRPDFDTDPLSTLIEGFDALTVRHYLDSALLRNPILKVEQRKLQILTTFDRLDKNTDHQGEDRLEQPLVLLELREIFDPVNNWVAEIRRDYDLLRQNVADSYARAQKIGALTEIDHARQRIQIHKQSLRSEVRDLDRILKGNAHINLRLAELGKSHPENWLRRDAIPDLVDLAQRMPLPKHLDAATALQAEYSASILEKFHARLEENGKEFNIRHYTSRTPDERSEAMRDAQIWAETFRATLALLRNLAPESPHIATPQVMNHWREATPSRLRSTALRTVDKAIEAAIARPDEITSLQRVLAAMKDWRSGKIGPTMRDVAMRQLEREILAALADRTPPPSQ
ncbi:hypothetical protein ACWGJX_38045 [Streptomyces sp. NPDC054775]